MRIYFYEPELARGDAAAGWRDTVLLRRAAALSDTEIVIDPGGRITRSFGALTSGVVGLYAPGGELLFWGGVTSARGHEGDNLGIDAIAGILDGADAAGARTPVYGCPIFTPNGCERTDRACCEDTGSES